MKILFCCESFFPEKGGVQEVILNLSKEMHKLSHNIHIATSYSHKRVHEEFNFLEIHEFKISGNLVSGLNGDILSYRKFIQEELYDVIIIKAAQQWSLDVILPIIESIKNKIIFIPCGFSAFYTKKYQNYYNYLSEKLKFFTHFIFYNNNYRDINWIKNLGYKNYSILKNGIDKDLYLKENISSIKAQEQANQIILHVGTFSSLKGQWELLIAYYFANIPNNTILIFNGYGLNFTISRILKYMIKSLLNGLHNISGSWELLFFTSKLLHLFKKNRKVIFLDLDRQLLANLMIESNLFVFPSQIEYAPLVILEALASGTPFISTDVGNIAQIISEFDSGVICPSIITNNSYHIVKIKPLIQQIQNYFKNQAYFLDKACLAKSKAIENLSWQRIAADYLKVIGKYVT